MNFYAPVSTVRSSHSFSRSVSSIGLASITRAGRRPRIGWADDAYASRRSRQPSGWARSRRSPAVAFYF